MIPRRASNSLHPSSCGSVGHQGASLFESGQVSSSLLGAECIGRHEPGTRQCTLQADQPFVNASRPYAEYGAVEAPARQYSVT
jgi:hypothetical protein